MPREGEPGRIAVGEGVEDDDLVGRPDRHAGSKGPDDPFEILALEQEGAVLLVVGKFAVVFEAGALRARHVEPVFEGAVEQEDRDAVHNQEPEDPAPGQGLHDFGVGKHEICVGDRRRGEEEVPGQKIAGEPFQESERPRRKHENGGNGESSARRPVSPLVPRAKLKVVHETLPPLKFRRPLPALTWTVGGKISRRS